MRMCLQCRPHGGGAEASIKPLRALTLEKADPRPLADDYTKVGRCLAAGSSR